MRDIKFRGKRVDGKGWVEGCFINYWTPYGQYTGIMDWKCDHYEVDPETVGQYTGVKDVDGKEIYEGDILMSNDSAFAPKHEKIEVKIGSLVEIGGIFQVTGNIYDVPNKG